MNREDIISIVDDRLRTVVRPMVENTPFYTTKQAKNFLGIGINQLRNMRYELHARYKDGKSLEWPVDKLLEYKLKTLR